jgi:hypothetical protein
MLHTGHSTSHSALLLLSLIAQTVQAKSWFAKLLLGSCLDRSHVIYLHSDATT